ncbi:hypothetical protein IQ31_01136 [Sphingobacterium siyangense]|uniref:Uncharacterized protein n=1 Tax=Sphingobacterium siyangense TaxID=459529 RepID=A0A562MSL4_9SPHI|nr:hypothetical protein IQ31_01136 [Sphingobacterium siyangense]
MTKSTRIIIIIFCLVKLTLHIIADFHSGFQGDELLHIETGNIWPLAIWNFRLS